MMLRKLESAVAQLFFWGAFLSLALGVVERVANELRYTVVMKAVKPATLLETAVVLLVFFIAVQLRAIHEELKPRA